MNRTPLVENCCPLDATSTATGRAACSEPATRSTLSTLCSSYASTPVRAPMPKRQVDSGAQGLRASSCTNHSPSSCTLSPGGPCASSTRTKRPARTREDGSARRSSSTSPKCTSRFSARVRSSTRSPTPAPSSPNGTPGSTPRHTLAPSPPLPPPAYRSKLASKYRCSSHSAGSSMTIERSCSGCASVSTSTPSRTAASLGVREYSAATPASGAPKSSARLVVALAADAEGETQRYSPLLVHRAATVRARSPNRQSRSLNGCASAPSARTASRPPSRRSRGSGSPRPRARGTRTAPRCGCTAARSSSPPHSARPRPRAGRETCTSAGRPRWASRAPPARRTCIGSPSRRRRRGREP